MNNLKSIKERKYISTYREAHYFVEQACESHKDHWDLIKVCQRHINGQKPIPDKTLKDMGMLWSWNFNFGKARAKMEKISAESIAKMSSALSLSYVTFTYYDNPDGKIQKWLQDPQRAAIAASGICLAFTETLRSETRLSSWFNQIEYPSIAFGYSVILSVEDDWIGDPAHPLSVAFPPNTKPHEVNEWIVFDKINAKELYRRWESSREFAVNLTEKGEPIPEDGWSYIALENILMKLFKGKINDTVINTWADVVPNYNEDPTWFIQNTEDLEIAKIYIKELNGNISETYIPWGDAWQLAHKKSKDSIIQSENANESLIIFQKSHNKKPKDFLSIVRDSGFSETGNIHDLKGLAKFAVEDSIRYNRIRNSLGNKSMLIGSPYFEKNNTQIGDKFKLTVSQGFVILPTSHTLLPQQPSYNISDQIGLLRFEESEYLRDTQQYDASIQGRLTSRPNRGEVERITEEVVTINNSKNNIKLRDYSNTFLNAIRSIGTKVFSKEDNGYEGQRRFLDLCKKYLPFILETDEDVKELVSCIDSFIIDPVITDEQTLQLAIQMAETPFARNRFKRMLLVAKGLPIEEVNIAVPLILDKFSMMQDDRIASIENDMFWTTNEVVTQGTDDHVIHFESHANKSKRVVEGVMQGSLDPVDAFKYLNNILPHMIGHLEMVGADPTLNFKAEEYSNVVRELIQARKQIELAAKQQLEAKAQQEGQVRLDPETEAEIASKNAKTMSDTQRKDWIAQQRTAQREKQIELNHEARLKEIELAAQVKTMKQ
jgi:hypothetical protein